MRVVVILLLVVATVAALPRDGRIVGGSTTNIQTYPYAVALLGSVAGNNFRQSCGGTIITNTSVLTAAHCFIIYRFEWQWRNRVGSTQANSGGSVFNTQRIIRHNNWNPQTLNNDIAIIRISGTFSFGSNVRQANLAGANYNVADNQQVWAVGWGAVCYRCAPSETLRHVQIWVVNQNICRQRYAEIGMTITDNMMCSGWLDVGGRDQCQGDSGGPLIHNNVIVGVCSFGQECAHPRYPGVNARVSRAINWILSNA